MNHNSIQKWRKLYEQGGITTLLKQTRGGKTREVITAAVHQSIEKRLTSSTNAFTSYKALQEWIDEKFIPGVKYITVVNYVKRKFHTKLKVARKSHIHKDANAVEAFKKNRRTV